MRIEQRISSAKLSPSEFILPFETEWNRIPYLSQSSLAGTSACRKIVKELFVYQEAKRHFLLALFAES
jgi:hypothetical protein